MYNNPPTENISAHTFWANHPTAALAVLNSPDIIVPIIPGKAPAAFQLTMITHYQAISTYFVSILLLHHH